MSDGEPATTCHVPLAPGLSTTPPNAPAVTQSRFGYGPVASTGRALSWSMRQAQQDPMSGTFGKHKKTVFDNTFD